MVLPEIQKKHKKFHKRHVNGMVKKVLFAIIKCIISGGKKAGSCNICR